jgi:hypothetical protein
MCPLDERKARLRCCSVECPVWVSGLRALGPCRFVGFLFVADLVVHVYLGVPYTFLIKHFLLIKKKLYSQAITDTYEATPPKKKKEREGIT